MSDTARYRRFLLTFLGTVVLLLGTVATFNFVVDPFQFFRKPILYRPAYFPGFQRYQNVGLARNYRYDTVIIGSSVTENFYPSYVNRALHVNALKLSISGSTAYEQALILTQAIASGQVKNVLWAIEPSAFSFGPKAVRDDQAPFPYYMYRWPRALNVEYLLAVETIRNSLAVLKGYGERDLETLETWDRRLPFSASHVLRAWKGRCEDFTRTFPPVAVLPEPPRLRALEQSIEDNLIRVIRANPSITFWLFFPPYSILAYIPADSAQLITQIPFERVVMQRLAPFPTVRVFDFQLATNVTHDLDNYTDPVHYGRRINEWIVDSIASDRFRVTADQVEHNLAQLIRAVNVYDLCRDKPDLLDSHPSAASPPEARSGLISGRR
jgi:hypothetical protein